MSDLDWPSVRGAVDIAMDRARREIRSTVVCALQDLGEVGKRAEAVILEQVQDSLDDIDQTIPPEDDDG